MKARVDQHLPLNEIDRRIRLALLTAAREGGHKAYSLMHAALTNGPSPGSTAEAIRFYGGEDNFRVVIKQMDPMIFALNAGMPGFSAWLDRTGFGNDCTMIRALHAWLENNYSSGDSTLDLAHASYDVRKKLN